MKHQEFIEYLTHPNSLGDASLSSLTEVADKFPYFQTAHLLVAKNLYNQNNINYNEQLKMAAIYAPDRNCLYNLIYNYVEVSSPKPQVSSSEPEVPKFQVSKFQKEENILDTKFQIKKEQTVTESIVAETTEIHASSSTSLKPETQNEKSETSAIPVIAEAPELPVTIETSSSQLTTHNPQPTTHHNSQLPFSEWLKSEKAIIISEPKPQPETTNKKIFSGIDLIDQFIKNEPKIIPSKVDFYSPVIKAKESLKEHDDFVSETLAKVYAKQGNISKSINIYDKLRLKYPEKSSYFAEEIKKLKDSQIS